MRPLQALLLSLALLSVACGPQRDEPEATADGIGQTSSALTAAEADRLLQRFRPYLKFSVDGSAEPHRPASWQWLYSRSSVCGLISNTVLRASYASVLSLADVRKGQFSDSAVISPSMFCSSFLDGATGTRTQTRLGEPWLNVQTQGAGLYGHVTEINPQMVNIEYWILFPYNSIQFAGLFGNHDYDIVGVQVVYDRTLDRPLRVSYGIHGSTLIIFDMFSAPPLRPVTLSGKDINNNPTSVAANQIDIPERAAYQEGDWFSAGPRTLYMAYDPVTLRYEHVVLFLEWGSHEPWPNPSGSITAVPNHNGQGTSFLPAKFNLLTEADAPFLYFGGHLGDPAGLMRHRGWYNPANNPPVPESVKTDRSPYVQNGYCSWPPKPAIVVEPPYVTVALAQATSNAVTITGHVQRPTGYTPPVQRVRVLYRRPGQVQDASVEVVPQIAHPYATHAMFSATLPADASQIGVQALGAGAVVLSTDNGQRYSPRPEVPAYGNYSSLYMGWITEYSGRCYLRVIVSAPSFMSPTITLASDATRRMIPASVETNPWGPALIASQWELDVGASGSPACTITGFKINSDPLQNQAPFFYQATKTIAY